MLLLPPPFSREALSLRIGGDGRGEAAGGWGRRGSIGSERLGSGRE